MYNPRNMNYGFRDDRFFAAPFLFGALAGGAAVGLTRPRPVYVNPYPRPYYGPGFGVPYYNQSYGYYAPYPRYY